MKKETALKSVQEGKLYLCGQCDKAFTEMQILKILTSGAGRNYYLFRCIKCFKKMQSRKEEE